MQSSRSKISFPGRLLKKTSCLFPYLFQERQSIKCGIALCLFSTAVIAGSDRVSIHQIKDWKAPSENELTIEVTGKRKYRAVFHHRCFGLRSADTVGFVTKGSNRLDAFGAIALPDGTRCSFKSFRRLEERPEVPIRNSNIDLQVPGDNTEQ